MSPAGEQYLVSLRNVLVHLLAQGDSSYNLDTRQHSLKPYSPKIERNFDSLRAPEKTGALILAGDLSKSLKDNPVIAEFIQLAGGENARVLIVSGGYPSQRSAQTNAEAYRDALGSLTVEIIALDKNADTPIEIPQDISGILFIGKDASLLNVNAIAPIKDAWLKGVPVLADNAAASLLGAAYANHGPTPDDIEQEERMTQKAFIDGVVDAQKGLGLLPVSIEPRVLHDNRWGKFFSIGYHAPDNIVIGLNDATAVKITSQDARVLGDNGIFLLDLRGAQLALGSNKGFVIANGLMDVFAPGEIITPAPADVNAELLPQSTPALPTLTPTATATLQATVTPTEPPIQPSVTPALVEETSPEAKTPAGNIFIVGAILVVVVISLLFARRKRAQGKSDYPHTDL
jgi:cyanophycinase-like exopeptidase